VTDDIPVKRILLFGASGTIGRAVLAELTQRRHDVVCFMRAGTDLPPGIQVRQGDITDENSLIEQGFAGESYDIVLSCMASRNGVPADAWAIDYQAHCNILTAAQAAGAGQFILLSSICVQRPLLAFQQAKLAFENRLIASGMRYVIVRPTAYFKSLSGQVDRVRQGKPFLLFGDGRLTACKPISDADLATYLADCLDAPERQNQILPIGGPGDAITPVEQGQMLFDLLGLPPKFRRVPVAMMDVIIGLLRAVSPFSAKARQKAELARIGRYYATESMLVWDAVRRRYDADATPAAGVDTLRGHYADMIAGNVEMARSEHSIF
jgi:divinyl chlorophyllide a 8-vinyl-reductase